MRASPMPHRNAVLVVEDAVLVFPLELVDFHLVAVTDRTRIECLQMPLEHLLHSRDHAFCSELRRTSGGPADAQRHLPTSSPCRERQEIGEIVVVVHVEMC